MEDTVVLKLYLTNGQTLIFENVEEDSIQFESEDWWTFNYTDTETVMSDCYAEFKESSVAGYSIMQLNQETKEQEI